jgi:hypothetical protein
MPENSVPLAAAGLIGYTSPGTGAAATCTVSGGVVQTTFTITAPGTGYSTAPTVLLSGGGGSGATATAAVSGGVVTGITRTAGGSGYTTAPVVVLSRLPSVTLADLDQLNLLAPFEVDFTGERIFQAIEGTIQSIHFNHFVLVDTAGRLRILDPRVFSLAPNQVTLTMDADPRVGRPQLTVDWSCCYQACLLRGNSLVVPQILQTHPWPGSSATDGGLITDFAHDGLTEAQAIAKWRSTDFTSPSSSPGTATGTATVASGAVTAIAVGFGGYNYASAPTVLITDATGTGATATATISSGVVTGFTVTAGGSGYSASPTVTVTGPAVGQQVIGTCTMPSTTSVVIHSADASTNFPANWWDFTATGHSGNVVLRSDVISGVQQTFTARVIANTSMAAGGTSTLTLDQPAPATSYTSFQLFGTSGGASLVYRRYKVTDAQVAARLGNYFPHPMAHRNSDGTAAQLTSTPVGTVFLGGQQSGIGISLDPVSGTITTAKPTALVFSADGITPVPVDNVQAFVPVFSGSLSIRHPTSGWSGTSNTLLGLQRVKTITFPDWRDNSNVANMALIASEYLDTVKDIVIEGSIQYDGFQAYLLGFGISLNIAGDGYPTGLEAAAVPVLSVNFHFNEGRDGATSYTTVLNFSNRRAPYSGRALLRPSIVGQPLGIAGMEGGFGMSGWAAGMESVYGEGGSFQQSQANTLGQSAGAFDRMGGDATAGEIGRQGAMATAGPDPMEGFQAHGNRLASTGTQANLFANRQPIIIQPETEEEASERRGRQRKEE